MEYNHGDVVLEGFLARPDGGQDTKRPAVLIVHAWRGHDAFVRGKARELAELGYVAFALDMYGKGVRAKDNSEAATLAGTYKGDRKLMRARARAGLDVLRRDKGVDATRIAAIGYCFGGTTVLELARDGADIAGVVSFHGGLDTTLPAKKSEVKAKILLAHGGDDPFVPDEQLMSCWKELRDARADYQILILSDAVHSFTDPDAGDDPSRGAAYDAKAAARAWTAMRSFFAEIIDPS